MNKYTILKICLLVFFGACFISVLPVFANTRYFSGMVNILAGATNTPPSAGSVVLADAGDVAPINLVEADAKQIKCTATVTDVDDCDELTGAEAVIYRSGLGVSCVQDKSNCYNSTWVSCTQDVGSCVTGTGDQDATYTCNITADGGSGLAFYAESTDIDSAYPDDDWSCFVTPSDGDGAGTPATGTAEVNSLLALDVQTSSFSYGSMMPNSNTLDVNQTVTIRNTGNLTQDIDLYGTAMDCGGGRTIPASNQKFSMTTPFTYATGGTALSGASETPSHMEYDLVKGANSAKNNYWGLAVPAIPASTCSGTITFVAKPN
jgi:hypothetical protein